MDLNIVTAKFCNNKKSAWTDEQWQWDYGQILQFEGLELPDAYEVHFSNIAIGGESITQIGNADGVTIPDQFFVSGETIYAWIYLHQGEDDGETEYAVTIPIKKRPQPSDDVPTPVEQSAIDQAIAALNVAVEEAETAITHYPKIEDGTWHVWDVDDETWVDTEVEAQGEPGTDGTDGTDGDDGFSPVITVTDITGGHRVAITDADGTQTFDVMDGQPGEPGDDGYSPTVTVTEITGGHRVIITDKNGSHTFDVMDGEDAQAVDAGDVAYDAAETYPADTVGDAITDLKADINNKADIIFSNASGAIASFVDGADGLPLESLDIDVTDGTPVIVTRAGKNLFPNKKFLTTARKAIILGQEVNYSDPRIFLKAGIEYTISVTSTISCQICHRDTNSTLVLLSDNADTSFVITFTVSSDGYYALYAYESNGAFTSVDNITSFMLEVGNTGSAYEPYQGDTYSFTTPYDASTGEITTLLGINNIWSDTGDTDVTYRADTKLYLESHIPNVPIDNILSSISENAVQNKVVTAEINQLQEDVISILGTERTIDHLTTFARGGAGSNGQYDTSYKYRVATPDIYTLTEDIIITIETGFRVYLNYFRNGTRISGGWTPTGTNIPSGSEIRMMIARVTEDTSEIADVGLFCSKVTYASKGGIETLDAEVQECKAQTDMLTGRAYGMTWNWWITSHSVDDFGTVYIGYVDTDGYAGILRRQPDGVTQYKRLEKLANDDDHNAPATIVLDDGRILVVGSYGHSINNHIVCWRSKTANSIDEMEELSFDITGSGYTYKTCYSQVFNYNGMLFDFLRFGSIPTGGSATYGYACLISTDNGSTWTAYKAFNGTPYSAFAQCTDDQKYLKVVVGKNPSDGSNTFVGCYVDLSTYKIYNLSGTQIGTMVALNGGSIVDESCAQKADMTEIITQTTPTQKGRLFFTANAELADTIFLYAIANDSTDADFTYKVYKNGTVTDIGNSGTPFGNGHYISGACFGADENTVYYSKATTEKADSNHELHKVKISSGSVTSDDIITEASICILRPLFLGNGELATVVGHYNDQNSGGTYNGSFTAWELKPLFTHA